MDIYQSCLSCVNIYDYYHGKTYIILVQEEEYKNELRYYYKFPKMPKSMDSKLVQEMFVFK